MCSKISNIYIGKKILFIIGTLFNGGATVSALNIVKTLIKNKCHVEVWSMADGELYEKFSDIGIKVLIINEFEFQLDIEKFKSHIYTFDVAICNTVVTCTFLMRIRQYIPAVWLIREGANIKYFVENNDDIMLALKEHKYIYSVSDYVKKYLYDNYLVNSKVIYNYITDDGYSVYKNHDKDKKFLVVGYVCSHKGQNLVLKANDILRNKGYYNYQIIFIGALTNDKEYCEEFLEYINKSVNATYVGKLANSETKKIIQKCDAVIVPSLDESCSLVTLESAMIGRPVLLSSNVGASYVIDDKSGWYFENSNAESIAECMEKVINEQDIEKYSRNIRHNYEKTTQYSVFEKNVLNMINEACLIGKITTKNTVWDKWLLNKRKNVIDGILEKIDPRKKKINVIIYGVSSRAECVYNLLQSKFSIEKVFWVDKNYSKQYKDIKILPPNKIKEINYDYIFITVKEEKTFKSICSDILEIGMNLDNVIWVSFNGVI